jgi:predicted RNA-binding Zn ribbon-like protein
LDRPPAAFIADAVGLDFLNSISTPVDRTIDWLDSGEGLLSWLEQAGMVPAEVLDGFRARAMPGELDSVAGQARSLREWFRAFLDERRGRPVNSADLTALEPLNRLLERNEGFSRIVAKDAGDGPLELRALRRWRSPEALLLPIAESLARLICEVDFTDVKACEGEACTLVFVDHTRGRQRRWCSMAVCGNRAKQAAHRHRARLRS